LLVAAVTISLTSCTETTKDSIDNSPGYGAAAIVPLVQDQLFTANGTANIFAAGLASTPQNHGASELPPTFGFTAGPGKILTIVAASGATDCCSSSTPSTPPNGGDELSGTDLNAFEDLSGIALPVSTTFISAVFTNERSSDNAPPADFDYTNVDTTTTVEFSPLLNQVFLVGDGSTSNGTTQSFFVPESATAVSFGVADGFGFTGNPGAYDGNTGEWQLAIRLE